MKHRGEIIEREVRKSGYTLTAVAAKIRKSRRHMYNIFLNPELNWNLIKDIGKAIHYDFSKDFDELKPKLNLVNEDQAAYKKYDINTCLEELNYWKGRFIEMLEKNNELSAALENEKNKNKKK